MLDRAFGILATAYLRFPSVDRLIRYTSRIFQYYLKDKFNNTNGMFVQLQFLLLKDIKKASP